MNLDPQRLGDATPRGVAQGDGLVAQLARRSIRYASVAISAAALVLLAPALPAHAATTAVVQEEGSVKGDKIVIIGSDEGDTKMWALKEDGSGKIHKSYCVDKELLAGPGTSRTEKPWSESEFPEDVPGKLGWVLNKGYPATSLEDLEDALNEANSSNIDLSQKQAIAGTQAAVWILTDGIELDSSTNDTIEALASYLVEGAEAAAGVTPELEIEPVLAEGEAGDLIGPFVVKTNADEVQVALEDATEGAELLDKDGDPIGGPVTDGTELYVQSTDEEDGSATIAASAEWVQLGARLFVPTTRTDELQRLIVPKKEELSKTAKAEAKWTYTPPPTETPTTTPTETETPPPPADDDDELPLTGSTAVRIAAFGGMLVASGLLVAYVMRRRLWTAFANVGR